ncbi:MAG: Trm112 family protein [Desulfuromonadaceae bacterium]|nr:Trm112 family protein [Desulfuromonadaceae bacterium]MDD5104907.1 Trm112 family protein [Desulfuromonadaceae bacterium]
MLPPELLHILACPSCKGKLVQNSDGHSLLCSTCDDSYPVVEGIPVLLPVRTGTASCDTTTYSSSNKHKATTTNARI